MRQWNCAKAHGLAIGNIVGNFDAGNIGPREQRVPRKMTSLAADRDFEHRVYRSALRHEQKNRQDDDGNPQEPFGPSQAAHLMVLPPLTGIGPAFLVAAAKLISTRIKAPA